MTDRVPKKRRGGRICHPPRKFLYYLSLHRDCKPRLMNVASDLSHEELDVSTDPEIINIKKMVNNVLAEIHLMRGFVRLTPIGDIVLYGYLKPRHNIGQHVSYIMSRRFPDTILVLGNNSESWVSFYDGEKAFKASGQSLNNTVDELKGLLNASEDRKVEDLWETFYWSQYIDERRNIRYYKKNMPKQYMDSAGTKVARNTGRITLDDFR